MLQARLQTGPVVSLHLRGGRPAPFEPKFLWRIFGSKGEIEVSGEAPMLNTRTQGIKLRLHDQESDKVDEVEVDKDGFEELPQYAQNIGRVYEAFATGDKDKVLVDFEAALKRHELIDGMLKHWDSGEQGWKI
jgi:predicted dehydrogenase